MTTALFDAAAKDYDDIFTNSKIGKLQRSSVWNYLESILPNDGINILELNCGTGEDAVWLGKKGHHVLATDVSEKMVEITSSKVISQDLSGFVSARVLDINEIDKISPVQKFDLVFSNFGGLNCLNENELKILSKNLKNLLNPDGRFIAVVMPDFCMIESIYYLLKLRFDQVLRRKKKQNVKIGDANIDTYYYGYKTFSKIFDEDFYKNNVVGIGMFVPPSYLNNFFDNKNGILKFLGMMENIFAKYTFSALMSDHYLIDLVLKK